MTEQVRVAGFGVPPVPTGADITQHSREGVPPTGMQPGFVPPPQTPPAPQAPAPDAPAPAAAPGADPTLLALLAALGNQQTPAPAAPTAQAPAPVAPASADPVVNSLTGILTSSGVDVQRAIAKAVEYGDASLIDKAYIASVGGANSAHLTQLAESLVAHAGRESEAAEQSCYALAGSRENFQAAVAVWIKNAPSHLQTVVQSMMDSGNRSQSDAGAKLIVEYAKANGGLLQPAGLIAGGAAPGQAAALSKEQFQTELRKLNPNDRDYAQQRGELYGRRAMGKQLGR